MGFLLRAGGSQPWVYISIRWAVWEEHSFPGAASDGFSPNLHGQDEGCTFTQVLGGTSCRPLGLWEAGGGKILRGVEQGAWQACVLDLHPGRAVEGWEGTC